MKQFLKSVRSSVAFGTSHLPGTSRTFGVPRKFSTHTEDWFRGRADVSSPEPNVLQAGENRLIELSPRKLGPRRASVFIDEPLRAKAAGAAQGEDAARFVASLHRGRYIGSLFGVVVTEDDTLLQDISLNNDNWCREVRHPSQHNAFKNLPYPLRRISGDVIALNTPFAYNFHHFLLDTIPRLGMCEEAGIDFRKVSKIILDYTHTKYQTEVIGKLGLELSMIQETSRRLHLEADRLHVASISEPISREQTMNYSAEGMEFVRRILRPKLERGRKRRILLSRRMAHCRRWMEEDEALPELEKMGFVRVECEKLTVTEQAQLFGEAEAVIMPHGGGMANCVFCEPGTKIFELFHPAYHPVFMLPLSHVMGLDYHAIAGDAGDAKSLGNSVAAEVDVHISPKRMLEILRTYL